MFKKLLCISLLLISATWLIKPQLFIPIYKWIYVRSIRIFKSDFATRFTKKELELAIAYASKQPWVKQQIALDLEPFKTGITKTQLAYWFKELQHSEQTKLVKFTIKDHKIIVDTLPEFKKFRAYKTVYSILALLVKYDQIPDCEFIIALNDYISYIPKNFIGPAAIFTFAKDLKVPVEQTTILVPDWMNVRYWDVLKGRIKFANYVFPWRKKLPLIHWRGGAADSTGDRHKLINLAAKFTFLDVGMTEGVNQVARLDPEFSIAYKYQIALDGSRCTWERVVWQMAANTLLIKPDSSQVQWFYRGLKAYNNYVPLAKLDEQHLVTLYTWLQQQDNNIIPKIIMNANNFAANNFKTQDFFAYYAVLLREYAKLIRL